MNDIVYDLTVTADTELTLESASRNGLAYRDLRMILAWIGAKSGSKHTQRAFRIEAQRWLSWIIWSKSQYGLPQYDTWLDKADALDAAAYDSFLATAPTTDALQAIETDIDTADKAGAARAQPPIEFPAFALAAAGMKTQPFRTLPLKKSSRARAISALKTMYNDMIDMHVNDGVRIERNPFNKRKVKADINRKPRRKALTEIERTYVDSAIEGMRLTGDIHYHQCRWIWNALLWSALRRSELAAAKAGDIYLDSDENGAEIWKLDVMGKGDKAGSIPLCAEFMKEFRLYREYHGFSPFPVSENEETPLVMPLRGNVRGDSKAPLDQIIYREIKRLMNLAADEAVTQGNLKAADRLRNFASHSARHTCITRVVDLTGDITLGQDMARHASIVTTRGYKAESVSRLADALDRLGKRD